MHLSVIVPAYNEKINLFKNVNKFNKYLSCQNYDYEIIIVNDGSTDNTKKIAEALTRENNKIKLIDNKINRGKGAAVRDGFIRASGDYRLFIDADGATSVEHVDLIWPKFKEGDDIVIGSRNYQDIPGAEQTIPQPLWKRLLGVCGNFIIRFLTIKNIYDTQCGFKAFTKRAAEDIIKKMTINRWGFDVEMLAIAKLLNYKISIIPVRWNNSANSRVKIRGYFSAFFEILLIKWRLITNYYK